MSSDPRPRISGLRKVPGSSGTVAAGAAGLPGGAGRSGGPAVRIPALDLKVVQRRAYERGRAKAHEEAGAAVSAALHALAAARAEVCAARAKDQEALSAFAVDLACALAEELLLVVVDREEHDVRGMARRVLDEVLPDALAGAVCLEGNPEDLALLALPEGTGGKDVQLVPCPSLPRGSFRARAGDTDYRAGLKERLEAMRAALRLEVCDGVA